jgi:DNA-binding transcriptional MocR family regulator
MEQFTDDPTGGGPRVRAIVAHLMRRMDDRDLAEGTRLPSIRALAQSLGASATTVAEAYDRLAASGHVEARRGSGMYVRPRRIAAVPQAPAPEVDRAIDPHWLTRQTAALRQSGRLAPDSPLPGCGWLPEDWMPVRDTQAALRALAREGKGDLVGYGPAQGLDALRDLVADRLVDRGIPARRDTVILTDGVLQGVDLLCRALTRPGDRVLLDDPGYFNFVNLVRANGLIPVPVPWTRTGPDLAAYEAALAEHAPRLHVTNAFLQNPTGGSIAPSVAHRLLALAETHGVAVIEDDIYGDLDPSPAPRLAALDGLRRVAHVGGFTKTQSAAARVGYLALPGAWVESLMDLRMATTFGNGGLAAQLALRMLSTSAHRRHVESLRARLGDAAGRVMTRLKALGFTPWGDYQGGFTLWMELPPGLEAGVLARHALTDGLILAPGEIFGDRPDLSRWMRFNAAHCQDPTLWPRLGALMDRAAADQVLKPASASSL